MAPGATDFLELKDMSQHLEVRDLLEHYLQEAQAPPCWVTVRDIRNHCSLDESAGPRIAGFLQRLASGPVVTCPYKVRRIEKFVDTMPPYRIICRYLVEERLSHRQGKERKSTGTGRTR